MPPAAEGSRPAHSPGLPGSRAAPRRARGPEITRSPGSSRGGLCGAQPRTPEPPRTHSVPVETQERNVPSTGGVWGEGPRRARRPWQSKRASTGGPATQIPQGSKGGSCPVTSAPGGGPPRVSREEKIPVPNKRERNPCPRCEGRSERHEPQLRVRREGGREEGLGRRAACYRGRRRSPLPPPPRSSCSSARAAGARARPRPRPPAPRGLLGAVVPGHAGRLPVTWGEELAKLRGGEGVYALAC